jgi:hypothetical protein
MTRHRQAWLFVIALLALVASAVGCGGPDEGPRVASIGSTSVASGATPAADRAELVRQYTDCLRQQGVTMLDGTTEEGMPQIDKIRTPVEKAEAAFEKCRAYLPTGEAPPRPLPADIEARQRHAACVRSHGVAEYPDPDPQTGEPAVTDQLARRLKNHPRLQSALEACQGILPSPTSTGVVGG